MAVTTKEKTFNGLDIINAVLETPVTEVQSMFKSFHTFSMYNQFYAMLQMQQRKMKITPIRTFNQWKSDGYSVVKGAKAIKILFPIMKSIPLKDGNGNVKKDENGKIITLKKRVGFTEKSMHFAQSETTCKQFNMDDVKIDNYNLDKALKSLNIKMIDFNKLDLNIGGFTSKDNNNNTVVSINTVWGKEDTLHTLFHEMAHVVFEHASKNYQENRGLFEYEADMTAFIACKCLGLSNEKQQQKCKAYISSWLNDDFETATSDKEVHKIMSCVDKILKAGL